MKMCCMGEMGGMMGGMKSSGMGGMKGSPSTMPGQPGASHLYHIGSTGFFLDHAKHIALTPEQKKTLNWLKEKALLDRRMNFIRAVGEATNVLTHDQHRALLGTMTSNQQ
jgi:hypothetical protein